MARDRIKERAQDTAFIGISVEKARWSKMNNLGLTSLNSFIWLLLIGVIPSCLIHGSGVMKAEKYCLLAVGAR